jgi:hypothetical protein
MHRFNCPPLLCAALLALCASTGAFAAEMDFNALGVPAESQSSAPAQLPVWAPGPSSSSENVEKAEKAESAENMPKPQQREQAADPGGAVFIPFAESARAPAVSAAPHVKPAPTSRGLDVPGLALTLVAVLGGVAALAWLLRRA